MANILQIVAPLEFAAFVRAQLGRADGDEGIYRRHQAIEAPAKKLTREAFALAVQRESDRALVAQREALAKPEDPRLLRLVSWQYGATKADTVEGLEQAARKRVALTVQSFAMDYRSSAQWLAAIEPRDPRGAWLSLADRQQAEGRWLQARASRAAARWLDPTVSLDPPAGTDDPAREFIDPTRERRFEGQPWKQRHWLAWDCKNYGLLEIATLLAVDGDESFSVRARVYRSLGQLAHPAAVHALREGLGDPHPFARAQAARSLGWISDPAAVPALLGLARTDEEPEVKRSARVALARIVAYWEHYGRWPQVLTDRDELRNAAKKLRAAGAFGDVMLPIQDAPDLGPEQNRDPNFRYDYHQWFEDAAREDAMLDAALRASTLITDRFSLALERKDARELCMALAIASRTGDASCEQAVRGLLAHPEPTVQWHARRALRARASRAYIDRSALRPA